MAVVSGIGGPETYYYHGVALTDFGGSNDFDVWAPVQTEAALGTASDTIDQTVYMSKVFINSIENGYSAGANATENYGAETDNKTWFLNDARFISQEEWDFSGGENTVELALHATASGVTQLSDSTYGFLYADANGERAIRFYDASAATYTNYAIDTDAETATKAQYNTGTNIIDLPTGITVATGDQLFVRYAGNAYADASASAPAGADSTRIKANYFTALAAGDTTRPEDVGGLRQGQIEIYLVDPTNTGPEGPYEASLRLQSVTISATLTREALNELGHLKPYSRALTFPVEITTAVETTAGDLETFAKFSGKGSEFTALTLDDLSIGDLLSKDNLILVVMVYQQTDDEAGGIGASRKVLAADMVGKEYFVRGVRATYAAINQASPEREYPLKTIIVPGLKVTDEAYNNSVGANSTQSFSFRSTNKLYWIKGYVDFADVHVTPGIAVNA